MIHKMDKKRLAVYWQLRKSLKKLKKNEYINYEELQEFLYEIEKAIDKNGLQ